MQRCCAQSSFVCLREYSSLLFGHLKLFYLHVARSVYLLQTIAQFQQQQQNSSQQQQLQQHALSSQQSQSSNLHLHQQDKMGPGSVTMDGSMSNSFRGNDQVFCVYSQDCCDFGIALVSVVYVFHIA